MGLCVGSICVVQPLKLCPFRVRTHVSVPNLADTTASPGAAEGGPPETAAEGGASTTATATATATTTTTATDGGSADAAGLALSNASARSHRPS